MNRLFNQSAEEREQRRIARQEYDRKFEEYISRETRPWAFFDILIMTLVGAVVASPFVMIAISRAEEAWQTPLVMLSVLGVAVFLAAAWVMRRNK